MRYSTVGMMVLAFLGNAVPVAAYDIRADYCGVVINFKYCKCAFHNQYCSDIQMSKSAASAYVQAGFNEWVCGKDGGTWTNNACTKKTEPEPEPTETIAPPAVENEESAGDATTSPHCDAIKHKQVTADGECACAPLYLDGAGGECVFAGAREVDFSAESAILFQEMVERMGAGEGRVFEGDDLKGNSFKIGVLRQPDGSFVFTTDGYHFYSTAKEARRPGMWLRAKTGWGDLWTAVGGWFGVGKYTGKDTADDPEKQRRGQWMLDASSQALKELIASTRDPEEQFDTAREIFESWPERAKNYYEGKEEDLWHDALSSATGVDTKLMKNVFTRSWGEIGDDQFGKLKKGLMAFPAETIKTLASELKKADFANAVRAYANEREAGKKPEQVFALFMQGELPEIETAQLRGASQAYTKPLLFTAYENAYQRYLLRAQLQ